MQAGSLDPLLRRPPSVYSVARRLIERQFVADPASRRTLDERLLAVALRRARRAPAYADVRELGWCGLTDKSGVRRHPDGFRARTLLPTRTVRTSGTTGSPLELKRTPWSIVFEQAAVDWIVARAGHDLARERVATLRGDHVKPIGDRRPPYGRLEQGGRMLRLSSVHLDRATVRSFVDELRAFRPAILHAHPSAASSLARLMAETGDRLTIPLILTSSEVLTPEARQQLAAAFGGCVVDYYSQAERVAAAYSLQPGEYYFVPAYGRAELAGEPGEEEIVGTPFHNAAMPLLRYRTGDRIMLHDGEPRRDVLDGLRPFRGIEGRGSDVIYGSRGAVYMALSTIPRSIDAIDRMQFIQASPIEVEMRVDAPRGLSAEARAALLEAARTRIGPEMRISLAVTEALVRTAAGKVPLVVHEWRPAQ